MTATNEDLIRSLYVAFGQRDIDGIQALLSDDVVFHQPGRNPLSGDYQGVPAVLELIGALAERSGGTFRAEVHDVLASEDHRGRPRQGHRRAGRTTTRRSRRDVFHLRDGKLAEMWVHPSDQYAVDDFWA